jgi:hypothetical protein
VGNHRWTQIDTDAEDGSKEPLNSLRASFGADHVDRAAPEIHSGDLGSSVSICGSTESFRLRHSAVQLCSPSASSSRHDEGFCERGVARRDAAT